MKRPLEVIGGAVTALRERLSALADQSERTVMIGTILLVSTFSAAISYVLTQYYAVDVLSSLLYPPNDCVPYWGMNIGRHCFSDYTMVTSQIARPNPWEPYEPYLALPNPGPAALMVPHMFFAAPAAWLHAPMLGLYGYLLALTIAVFTPAVWAARGARGLERVVVFVACGAAAIPAWVAIDRANSVGFAVPITLVFLVALLRQRWGLVAIMVVLAALVKPQFAVLAFALFAARQWRLGGMALGGMVISQLAAYLLWWRDFPGTIVQTLHNAQSYVSSSQTLVGLYNVSFAKAILFIPDSVKLYQTGGKMPDGFLDGPRKLIGGVVLLVVIACVLALGRRIPPVMVGIVLLATASLFPALTYHYYLVFAVPVAALVARDPDGPPGTGIFDRLATLGDRRRAVGICVSLAAALTIAQIAGYTVVIPILWLVACATIVVSYVRRPAPSEHSDRGPGEEGPVDTAANSSPTTAELITES